MGGQRIRNERKLILQDFFDDGSDVGGRQLQQFLILPVLFSPGGQVV
jgi:hypothetical protein